jgi:hypothetical protein
MSISRAIGAIAVNQVFENVTRLASARESALLVTLRASSFYEIASVIFENYYADTEVTKMTGSWVKELKKMMKITSTSLQQKNLANNQGLRPHHLEQTP